MDVRLPNGTVVRNVPEGTSKDAVMQKAISAGLAKREDFPSPGGRDEYRRSLRERVIGVGEAGLTMLSAAAAEPVAGLRGIGAAAIPGGQTGAEAVESTREAMRYEPRTEAGQDYVQATGEALEPVANAIQSAESALGDAVYERTQSPALAALATTFPTLAAEVIGVGAVKGGRAISRARKARKVDNAIMEAAPSTDQLREVSNSLFREIDDMGVTVEPRRFQQLVGEVAETTRRKGVDVDVTPASSKALARLKEAADSGEPLPLSELETLREVAQGAAKSIQNPHDAMLGSIIVEKIDDFMYSPGLKSPQGGAVGANVGARYKAARDLWGRMRRGEELEWAAMQAENQATGFENGLRTRFRSILNNKKKRRFFPEEDLEMMQKVVQGTATSNTLKKIGKLGFGEGQASNMLGGGLAGAAAYGVGGWPAAVGVAGAGTAARKAAQMITARHAGLAEALTRAGKDARSIARAYLERAKTPDPNELSKLFLAYDVDVRDVAALDDISRKAAEIAARRQAELAGAAVAGSSERGATQNVVPFAAQR